MGGQLVAFANIWTTGNKHELSVDLMRHDGAAPRSVMDFLMIELMSWGQAQGFQWFNLGMAPLSGLADREFSPTWNRVGAFVYRHGEHFYNFEGLRAYKQKFPSRLAAALHRLARPYCNAKDHHGRHQPDSWQPAPDSDAQPVAGWSTGDGALPCGNTHWLRTRNPA